LGIQTCLLKGLDDQGGRAMFLPRKLGMRVNLAA
jgi:hypothetical protein